MNNPMEITFAGFAFSTTIDKNIEHLVNKVKELENKLDNSQQENERLHTQIQVFTSSISHEEDFWTTKLEEIRVMEDVIKQLSKEMIILQKKSSSLMDIQNELKGKGALLKQALITLMYEQGTKYLDAPTDLSKKDRMGKE